MDAMNLSLSILGSVVGVVAFCFMTFATKHEVDQLKEDFKGLKSDIDKRLERIEDKIDRLIERKE